MAPLGQPEQRIQLALNLASFLVSPTTIDASLSDENGSPGQAIDGPGPLRFFFGETLDPLARSLISGYAIGRRATIGSASATVGVFRYSDAKEASGAVSAVASTRGPDRPRLAGYPEGVAVPAPSGIAADSSWIVPYREFIVLVSTKDLPGHTTTELIQRQQTALDGFLNSKLSASSAEADPFGVLALTVPLAEGGAGTGTGRSAGYYVPAAWIHGNESGSWAAATDLYKRAGVDVVGRAGNIVYRTQSPAQAELLRDHLSPTPLPTAFRRVGQIPGLPSSRCAAQDTSDGASSKTVYNCVATAKNFVVQAFGTSFAQVQQKVAASVKSATSVASVPATTTTRPATVATRTDKLLPTADSVSTLSGLQLATPRRSYERAPDVVVEPSACRPTAQPDSETTWTGAVSTTVDKYTKLQSGAESPLAFGIRAAAFGDAAAADRSYRTTENAIDRCSSYMFEGATWQARRIPTPAANRLNWSINGPSAYCVTSYALVRNVILMAKQCSAKPSDSDVTGRIVDGMTTEAER